MNSPEPRGASDLYTHVPKTIASNIFWFVLHDFSIRIFLTSVKDSLFFYRTTAPSGPGPPHYRNFMITLRHTTIGRTPLDEWSAQRRYSDNTRLSQEADIHVCGNPRKRVAADPLLRPRGHLDRRQPQRRSKTITSYSTPRFVLLQVQRSVLTYNDNLYT